MIRRQFSLHELSVASATGYIRAIDRHQRQRIKSYPIDNHEPLRASDRDDAVFAEKTAEGYVLQVTIADVAAHIPKDSILDKAAQKRAFTIYRPPARDPMFPFVLSEDRFSLEHEQERLGLTAIFTLDEAFALKGVRFARTIVESECQDYASASHRMIQEGDDMALLAQVAQGIKRASNPAIRPYDAGDSAYMDKTGHIRQGDAGTMAAAKLVQVLMIFANNEIANFFNATGLPFLYRNHDGKTDELGQLGRAEYEPFDDGHYGLRRSDGLKGAYSHCTSPIRRYADLVNQRMQHYAMDVVEAISGELMGLLASPERRGRSDTVSPIVWEHAPDILRRIYAVHRAQGADRFTSEKALKDALRGLLNAASPEAGRELYRQADPLAQLSAAALRPAVPYSHDELLRITPVLNTAGAAENEAVAELNIRNLTKWNERVTEDFAAGNFDKLSEGGFSTLLRRAAVTGRINEDFAREAVARIKSGRADKVQDCYSALILSKEYQNKYWRAVKRAALNAIERDPMATNNVFDKAMREDELHPDTYIAEADIQDSSARKSMPLMRAAGVEQSIDAALVVTYMEGLEGRGYAAQSYSLGYNKKDTARHARFNFIRALS
ncbi:MAG: RNB domain-containing ribonuclease, partial [Alphaproteobacteria bacterium]|nr:RNB domain-containing ribonuclease [Alphaproteobacteria bacterium]